jgi:hypothetical protein
MFLAHEELIRTPQKQEDKQSFPYLLDIRVCLIHTHETGELSGKHQRLEGICQKHDPDIDTIFSEMGPDDILHVSCKEIHRLLNPRKSDSRKKAFYGRK